MRPRRLHVVLRVLAALFVIVFSLVVVSTTIVSIGDYCLTSDAGNTGALHPPDR